MSEKAIGYKQMVDIGEAVAYLEALARGFQDGRIVVTRGAKTPELVPPSVVVLEIEAKQKKDKTKFGFEVTWKKASKKDGEEALRISPGSEKDPEDLPPAA